MLEIAHSALAALAVLTSTQPPAPDAGQARVGGTTVMVVAQREPADLSSLPLSASALPTGLLTAAGITFVGDAAPYSPNTHFTEFTARKLSNPRIRGIGASPSNPGVATYIDGVAQLNSNTSSVDFVDIDQVEIVRGPQSALFGRNALGGVINISSARPAMDKWGGYVTLPFGSDDLFEFRAGVSGPIQKDKLAAGFGLSFGKRSGFSVNSLTGNDVDFREGITWKGQLLWTPTSAWDARVILSGERARDGDYALNDLDAVRATPFDVMRDFEGHTDRDIFNTTILARYQAPRFTFTSTTGYIRWKTFDATDLDYTPLALATRENHEEATQFSEEARLASAAGKPITFGGVSLRWQAGAIVYTQNYEQNAANSIAAFVLSPMIGFPVVQTTPLATLEDTGVGVYGQGTLSLTDRLDVSAGVRFDREERTADLFTGYLPMIAPDVTLGATRTFSDVSPQFAAAFRMQPRTLVYGTVARAFKAGGFNPVSLPGREVYDEEHAWNTEAGIKMSSENGRYSWSAAAFSIMWDNLQLNVPIVFAPGQFFIDNVGEATSRGVEVELMARPVDALDLFGGLGVTRARFSDGSTAGGFDVSGNKIPNTPAFTAMFGAQYSHDVRGHRLYGRADVAVTGAFQYDEANTQGQDAYTITNLRLGVELERLHGLKVEGFVRNAFDTRYTPLAFAFPGFTASGFLAEPGRPRTFGISVGVRF